MNNYNNDKSKKEKSCLLGLREDGGKNLREKESTARVKEDQTNPNNKKLEEKNNNNNNLTRNKLG